MGANSKILKRRIRSVSNTRKITKAMELVAASKMRRAMNSVLATRPFAHLAWDTVTAVTKAIGEKVTHPLLVENFDAKKDLVILFTSDRGLAGALNTNIVKTAIAEIKQLENIDAISVGRKGNAALARNNINVIGSFEELTNKPKFEDTLPITKLILEKYREGEYRRVFLAYTDFKSALSQVPRWMQLLPLGVPDEELGETNKKEEVMVETSASEYTFEPSPEKVLDRILPRLVETMMYQALLESAASEHSSRMMAMRSATDNAGEMLDELKMTFNRVRQSGITQEISEISAGKAALE